MPIVNLKTGSSKSRKTPKAQGHVPAWLNQSARNTVMVGVGQYRGMDRIDFRVYYNPDGDPDGEFLPTRKGISVPFTHFHALLDTLFEYDDETADMLKTWIESRFGVNVDIDIERDERPDEGDESF